MGPVRIVGSVLVRNEDAFVEVAIRNIAAFCDRIHVIDHMSFDGTWDILRSLGREFDHLEVRRARKAGESHKSLERYAGTRTWVLGADGDELFDAAALGRLRECLLAGEHSDVFRLKAHVLNCEAIDWGAGTASGYMAPPSRPVTKLFNLAAVDSWSGCCERLHAGDASFRPGFNWNTVRYVSDSTSWEDDPLRCLHVCFLVRSSQDDPSCERLNLNESGAYNRTLVGAMKRHLRPAIPPQVAALHREGSNWKRNWYARGGLVTVNAMPFLAPVIMSSVFSN